jgi:hypothetical protein
MQCDGSPTGAKNCLRFAGVFVARAEPNSQRESAASKKTSLSGAVDGRGKDAGFHGARIRFKIATTAAAAARVHLLNRRTSRNCAVNQLARRRTTTSPSRDCVRFARMIPGRRVASMNGVASSQPGY